MKKMKNLFVIGLFCMALTFGACSSSSEGGYVGETEISSFPQSGGGKETKEVYNQVFALLTEKGGGTIEFSDTNAISKCKLQLESLADGNHREVQKDSQTCVVEIDGVNQSFAVDLVVLNNYTKDGGKIFITVIGQAAGTYTTSKTHVQIAFKGERYEKK